MSLVSHDRKPTILLVEDSQDEEMLVVRAVRQSSLSCQVVVVHTTDEATDYLFRRGSFEGRVSDQPDVILTDLRVGSIGGAALASEIRTHPETRLLPVVVLTGSASEDQIQDLYKRGANSFIEKPIDFDEFSVFIERIARYWCTLNAKAGSDNPTSFPYTL